MSIWMQEFQGQLLTKCVKLFTPKQPLQQDGSSCGLHVLVSLDSLMAEFEPPPLISKMVIAQRMFLHNDVLKNQLQLNPTVKAKYCSADPEYPALKSTKENATLLRQWISTIFCLQAQPRWEGAEQEAAEHRRQGLQAAVAKSAVGIEVSPSYPSK